MWLEPKLPENFRHPERITQAPGKRERRTGPGLTYDNPWKITAGEKSVLRAVMETGGNKAAASKLGLRLPTVEAHLASISKKMGAPRLVAILTWDRWERAQ
jgi:FixJ family two-component response regulator